MTAFFLILWTLFVCWVSFKYGSHEKQVAARVSKQQKIDAYAEHELELLKVRGRMFTKRHVDSP